jgi:fatty acid desaturase
MPEQHSASKAVQVPTLAEIKSALPKHCFKPSTSLSLYYVARDLLSVLVLGYAMHAVLTSSLPIAVTSLLAVAYALVQGTIFWGIFVLGHDCGHGSFSNSSTLNFIVGSYALCLLLPSAYFSDVPSRIVVQLHAKTLELLQPHY